MMIKKIVKAIGFCLVLCLLLAILFIVIPLRNVSAISLDNSSSSDARNGNVDWQGAKEVFNAIKTGLFIELDPVSQPKTDSCVAEGYEPVDALKYFGRMNLEKDSGGKLLVAAYDRVVAAADELQTRILLADFDNPISTSDFEKVFNAYSLDYPQHFWVSSYSCVSYKDIVLYVDLNFNMETSEAAEKRAEFKNNAQLLLNQLPSSLDEYDRELWIHDNLINACDYVSGDILCHTAYGCLVQGRAVCDGYAEAFAYLCRQVGLNATIAQNADHAWNVVEINGAPYIVDVTWDDSEVSPECKISYDFFNITTEQYLKSQSPTTSDFEIPVCTARAENYYVKSGNVLQNLSVKELADVLKRSGGKLCRAYIAIDPEVYRSWLQENFLEAAKYAGFSGSGKTYIVGNEMVVVLDIDS